MAVLVIILLLAAMVRYFMFKRGRAVEQEQENYSADNPSTAAGRHLLSQRCHRPDPTHRRRRFRAATPHIYRIARGCAATPTLITYSGDGVFGGLLVITTAQTVLFKGDKLRTVSHWPATHKARQLIDGKVGLSARKQFTAKYGRPDDDRNLPGWAARVVKWSRRGRPDVRAAAHSPPTSRAMSSSDQPVGAVTTFQARERR